MKYRDSGVLILLAAIWGLSYIFIRVAVPAFGPIGLALARVAIGSLGLLVWAGARGGLSQIPRINRRFLVLAMLNGVVPYSLIAFAELHVPASLAGILNATTPLFAAGLVAFLARERLHRERLVGLLLGIGGVGVLVGWSPIPITGMVVLAGIAMLISSGSYGAATVFAKRQLGDVPAFGLAIGQQLSGTLLLTPLGAGFALGGDADKGMTIKAVLAVVALGLLCTSIGYLLYFHLIHAIGPVGTSTVTFLIPLFSILWGWLFLDEHIRPAMIIGLVLILASVRLVNTARVVRREFRVSSFEFRVSSFEFRKG